MELDQETFNERAKCPKCQMPGEVNLGQVHRDKARTFSITCRNERCKWFNINWLVDVNPDGSLPTPRPHRKAYPAMPDVTASVQAAADREIERSMRQDGR